MLLFALSIISGVLTVLAPCILPLLPVIVGGSVSAVGESRSTLKAFVIVTSLGVSVIVFTLLLKVTTAFISVPPQFWTLLSGSVVACIGVTLSFPTLWQRLPFIARLSARSNELVGTGFRKQNFLGDVLIGASLGPVFTTCSPTYFLVLATVLPERPIVGLVYLLAYTLGLCLTLLLIGLVGQALADKLRSASDPRGTFKRSLGFLFMAVGLFIATGQDKQLQIKLLDWGIYDITEVEQFLLKAQDSMTGGETVIQDVPHIFDEGMRVVRKEQLYQRAPEIIKPAGYVNTDGKPITIDEFRGKKVVLLDIWTYSCINCQRTIPYLNAWHEKYADQGLQIIGIHTPEFAFEKDIENVEWAVQQFGIKYPSILDNEYATWKELGNNYWPRKYLVDIDGFIVYDHIGEGSYEETEAAIQRALMERSMVVGNGPVDTNIVAAKIQESDNSGVASPEIYFGAWRNERLGNGLVGDEGERSFVLPDNISRNILYLDGRWNITQEYAESSGVSKIVFKYSAKDVYMVASSIDGTHITVLRDGKPVGPFAGEDIDSSSSSDFIKDNRLYKLIHDEAAGEHTLEIQIEGAGLRAYTFTFG